MRRRKLTSKPMRHHTDNPNSRVYHMVDTHDGGLDIKEVHAMSRTDRAIQVGAKAVGTGAAKAEEVAVDTSVWIRDTAVPATIQGARSTWSKIKAFAITTKAEYHNAKDGGGK